MAEDYDEILISIVQSFYLFVKISCMCLLVWNTQRTVFYMYLLFLDTDLISYPSELGVYDIHAATSFFLRSMDY